MEGYTLVIQIRSEDRLRKQEKSVRSEGVEVD